MFRKIAVAAALTLSATSFPAHALGFGQIQIHSALSQPLNADIPLLGISPAEIGQIKVTIPPEAAFAGAGLRSSPMLDRIRINVVVNRGRPYVHLSTEDSVRHPFLDLLLRIESPGGASVRQFTVLLDPPGMAPPEVVQTPISRMPSTPDTTSAQQRSSPPQRSPRPDTTVAAGPATAAAMGTDLPTRYGPVRSGQTLWGIAETLRPRDAGLITQQMVMGIYNSNPQAFTGNINGLLAGSMLSIPSLPEVAALGPDEAVRAVRRQLQAPPPRAASSPEPVPKPVSEPAPAGRLELRVADPATAGVGAGSSGAGADDGATDTTSASITESNAGTSRAVSIPAPALAALLDQASASTSNPFEPSPLPPITTERVEPASGDSASATTGTVATDVSEPTAGASDTVTMADASADTVIPPVSGDPTDAEVPDGDNVVGDVAVASLAVAASTESSPGASQSAAEGAEPVPVAVEMAAPADSGRLAGAMATLRHLVSGEGSLWRIGLALVALLLLILLAVRSRHRRQSDEPVLAVPDDATTIGKPVATAGTVAMPVARPDDREMEDADVAAAISDADFNMAYDLYDKALAGLQPYLALYPARRDLRLRELEALYGAGRDNLFRERAQALRNDIADPADKDWVVVVAMGSKLIPGDPLFEPGSTAVPEVAEASSGDSTGDEIGQGSSDGGADDAAYTASVDSAEEAWLRATPVTSSASLSEKPEEHDESAFEGDRAQTPAGAGVPSWWEAEAEGGNPEQQPDTSDAGADAPENDDMGLDFESSDLPPSGGAVSTATGHTADNDTSADLDTVEFAMDDEPPAVDSHDAPGRSGPNFSSSDDWARVDDGAGTESDHSLDWNVDFGDALNAHSGEETGEDGPGDAQEDVGTKLDLARAYLDMEDHEMADSLLAEVMDQGDEAQREEARALKTRIG